MEKDHDGRRPGQRIAAQPIQHPLAGPIYETRDTTAAILRLLEGEDPADGSEDEDPIAQLVRLMTETLAVVQRIEARLPQTG